MNEWFHFQRDVQIYREAQSQNMQHSPKQLIKAYITPLNKIPIYTSIKMEKLSPSNNLFLSYYLVFMKSVLLLPILSNIVFHDLWAICIFFIPFYILCYLLSCICCLLVYMKTLKITVQYILLCHILSRLKNECHKRSNSKHTCLLDTVSICQLVK